MLTSYDIEFLTDISVTLECFEWPVIAYQFTNLGWGCFGGIWRHTSYIQLSKLNEKKKKNPQSGGAAVDPTLSESWDGSLGNGFWDDLLVDWLQMLGIFYHSRGSCNSASVSAHLSTSIPERFFSLITVWPPFWIKNSLFPLTSCHLVADISYLNRCMQAWPTEEWAKFTASPLPRWMTVSSH